jgi:hypothetical protein
LKLFYNLLLLIPVGLKLSGIHLQQVGSLFRETN